MVLWSNARCIRTGGQSFKSLRRQGIFYFLKGVNLFFLSFPFVWDFSLWLDQLSGGVCCLRHLAPNIGAGQHGAESGLAQARGTDKESVSVVGSRKKV